MNARSPLPHVSPCVLYVCVHVCAYTWVYVYRKQRSTWVSFCYCPLPFCLFIQLYFLKLEDNFISGWERNNKAGKLYVSTATGRRELRRWSHAWHGGRAERRRSCIFELKLSNISHTSNEDKQAASVVKICEQLPSPCSLRQNQTRSSHWPGRLVK